MASFTISDFDDIKEIPDSVLDEMLRAGAEPVAAEQRKNAASMLNQRGMGTGKTAASIRIRKAGAGRSGGRSIAITFAGGRPNGKSGSKRAAEVAFINEFGKRSMPGRQFIRTSNENAADDMLAEQEKIHDAWLESQ